MVDPKALELLLAQYDAREPWRLGPFVLLTSTDIHLGSISGPSNRYGSWGNVME